MSSAKLFSNLPNLITLARLLLAPLAIAMILTQRFNAAFAIFLVAGISDAIDGAIAKRFALTSKLGSYLDPLADKALLIGIYVTLAAIAVLPPWLPILVVTRDVMILAAVLVSWLLENPVEIRPVFISKVNTAAQIAYAAFLLGTRAFGFETPFWEDAIGWLVAVSTTASGAVYIAQWLDHMSL
jgi:cardiolipin synthase (CMP-forming)